MHSNAPYLDDKLFKNTSFFGVRLWIVIVVFLSFFLVVLLSILCLCIIYYRRRKLYNPRFRLPNPIVVPKNRNYSNAFSNSSLDRRLLPKSIMSEIEINIAKPEQEVVFFDQWSGRTCRITDQESPVAELEQVARRSPQVLETWRGNRFCFREIEMVTNGFSNDNVIGNGDYGVVYRGILLDNTRVAVKRLLNSSCPAEDFITEAETIGYVRHKNIVRLLGFCMEAGYRMLVYEYVDNGNLHQWLHESIGSFKPLTWGIRINIIQGIAKGLTYLHEDIEPRILHQDLKSSNILLDHQWNPKISDAALTRLLGPEHCQITAQALVELGYLARKHPSTSYWNEKNDVYSFGIIIMEIISGRIPVDCSQTQVYLIEWLKSMVANKKIEHVVDPNLPEVPSIKELKRVILIALRCVDPDIEHRPRMGEVIHMLEPRDLLLTDERHIGREASILQNKQESRTGNKLVHEGAFNVHEERSSCNHYEKKALSR